MLLLFPIRSVRKLRRYVVTRLGPSVARELIFDFAPYAKVVFCLVFCFSLRKSYNPFSVHIQQ